MTTKSRYKTSDAIHKGRKNLSTAIKPEISSSPKIVILKKKLRIFDQGYPCN
jgi:hypothetical protein